MEFYIAKVANILLEPLYILSFFLLALVFLLLFTNLKKVIIFLKFVRSNKKIKINKKKDNIYKGFNIKFATFAI